MPTLIEMRLKATWTVRPDTRQLHGLACALFEAADRTGHLTQDKPFAVWPLRPVPGTEHDWEWRVAWLPDELPPAGALTPDEFRIGHVTCAVTESVQRRITHAQLAASTPLSSVMVAFSSPTYFSQNGTDVFLPDPRLIVGSWRRRWNMSLPGEGPLTIGDDVWRETHRHIHLAAFDLRTENRDSGHGRDRLGFLGRATLQPGRNAPPKARSVLITLARFAEYCGTGAQTTCGFGATTLSPGGGSGDG